MLLFVVLSVLALGAASPLGDAQVKLQRGNCPSFWFGFNGRCYKYMATQMSWADAELYCRSQGANLVSVHSQEEHNYVTALIQTFDTSQEFTWIGLSDAQKEGAWMWSDGSPLDLVLWGHGEPNNAGGDEHCAHNNFGQNLWWNDEQCSDAYPFVCATRPNCHY